MNPIRAMNPIIVPCDACGTDGKLYHANGNDPNADWIEPCPYCDGTGGEIIEGEPITVEDAEFLARIGKPEDAR